MSCCKPTVETLEERAVPSAGHHARHHGHHDGDRHHSHHPAPHHGAHHPPKRRRPHQPAPAPAPPAAPSPFPPFADHFLDILGDGTATASWSAPGTPAAEDVWFDPASLTPDMVARGLDAVAAVDSLNAGITLVVVTDPAAAQIVVDGNPALNALWLANTFPAYDPASGVPFRGLLLYRLTHVEIQINTAQPFSTDPAGAGGSGLYDLRSTFTHEFGHALGLGHDPASYPVNDGYSPMNAYGAPGVDRWTFTANDVRELDALYAGPP